MELAPRRSNSSNTTKPKPWNSNIKDFRTSSHGDEVCWKIEYNRNTAKQNSIAANTLCQQIQKIKIKRFHFLS